MLQSFSELENINRQAVVVLKRVICLPAEKERYGVTEQLEKNGIPTTENAMFKSDELLAYAIVVEFWDDNVRFVTGGCSYRMHISIVGGEDRIRSR